MRAVLFFLLVSCGNSSSSRLANTTIGEDSKYVYIATPWVDFSKEEQRQALLEAKKIIIETLHERIPNNKISKTVIELLNSAPDKQLTDTLKKMENWVNNHQDRFNKFGFRLYDLIPSALIISIGGAVMQSRRHNYEVAKAGGKKISKEIAEEASSLGKGKLAGLGVAGVNLLQKGGSLTIGIIIIPYRVSKIHKITKEVKESRYRFKVSLVGIPDVSIVVRAEDHSNLSLRLGLGFVFGELNDPDEFSGFSFGYSLNYRFGNQSLTTRLDENSATRLGFYEGSKWHDHKGNGLNIKIAALKRNFKGLFQNVYVIASTRHGILQDTYHEYNAGPVLKLNKIVEMFTGQDFTEMETQVE